MGLVVAAGVGAELALDPQVFDEGRELPASAAGRSSAAGAALLEGLAGALATGQLGQAQLQQAAELTQQQGVVVGVK